MPLISVRERESIDMLLLFDQLRFDLIGNHLEIAVILSGLCCLTRFTCERSIKAWIPPWLQTFSGWQASLVPLNKVIILTAAVARFWLLYKTHSQPSSRDFIWANLGRWILPQSSVKRCSLLWTQEKKYMKMWKKYSM